MGQALNYLNGSIGNIVPANKYEKFGEYVALTFFGAPWGAHTKGEVENLVFAGLVRADVIDLDRMSDFELAMSLRCTTAKASTLRYTYELRTVGSPSPEELADHVKIDAYSLLGGNHEVVLVAEAKYWRDILTLRLAENELYYDTSFNRQRVKVPKKGLVECMPELFGAEAEEFVNKLDEAAQRLGIDGADGERRIKALKQLVEKTVTGAVTTKAQKFLLSSVDNTVDRIPVLLPRVVELISANLGA